MGRGRPCNLVAVVSFYGGASSMQRRRRRKKREARAPIVETSRQARRPVCGPRRGGGGGGEREREREERGREKDGWMRVAP